MLSPLSTFPSTCCCFLSGDSLPASSACTAQLTWCSKPRLFRGRKQDFTIHKCSSAGQCNSSFSKVRNSCFHSQKLRHPTELIIPNTSTAWHKTSTRSTPKTIAPLIPTTPLYTKQTTPQSPNPTENTPSPSPSSAPPPRSPDSATKTTPRRCTQREATPGGRQTQKPVVKKKIKIINNNQFCQRWFDRGKNRRGKRGEEVS